MALLAGLITLLIVLVVICFVAGILLWAVRRFFPEIETPARYVIGAVAIIFILLLIRAMLTGGMPALGF